MGSSGSRTQVARADGLRADAARNRGAIVAAAASLYAQNGLDTSEEIARHAHVGSATLYRHFPKRSSLVAAVFVEVMQGVIDAGERALTDPDPWTAFTSYLRFICRLQATNRALTDLLTTVSGAPELEQLRRKAHKLFDRVVAGARASGQLRSDFLPQDAQALLLANAGLVTSTIEDAPMAWSRFIDFALDGLRSNAATSATPAPSAAAMRRAYRRRGEAMRLH